MQIAECVSVRRAPLRTATSGIFGLTCSTFSSKLNTVRKFMQLHTNFFCKVSMLIYLVMCLIFHLNVKNLIFWFYFLINVMRFLCFVSQRTPAFFLIFGWTAEIWTQPGTRGSVEMKGSKDSRLAKQLADVPLQYFKSLVS